MFVEESGGVVSVGCRLCGMFCRITAALGFSRTSGRLFVSRSTIDRSVGALRQGLSRALFVQDAGGIRLAPRKRVLLHRVRPTVGLVRGNRTRLLSTTSANKRVHVNTDSAVYECFLIPCLRGFRGAFPGMRVGIVGRASLEYARLLGGKLISLVIIGCPGTTLGGVSTSVGVGGFRSIFVTKGGCPRLERGGLALTSLLRCPVLVLSGGDAAGRFLRHLFRRRRLSLIPRVRLADGSLLVSLTEVKLKVTFVPSCYLSRGGSSVFGLSVRRRVPRHSLMVTCGRRLPLTGPTRRFLGCFRRRWSK